LIYRAAGTVAAGGVGGGAVAGGVEVVVVDDVAMLAIGAGVAACDWEAAWAPWVWAAAG